MRPEKWPFRPDHITNDGETYRTVPELSKLSGVGIITNHRMRSEQVAICANLKNPTLIIEFSPKGEPVRTAPDLPAYETTPVCRLLAKCTNSTFCHKPYSAHARLFYGLTRERLACEIPAKIESAEAIRSCRLDIDADIGSKVDHEAEYVFTEDAPRLRLEYDCPFLGFREILFPVFFESRVIAVFFVSELTLEDRVDYIRARHEDFLTRWPGVFDEFCRRGDRNPAFVLEKLRIEFETWAAARGKVWNTRKYKRLIGKACKELDDFEEMLAEQINRQRQDHISLTFDRHTKEFYSGLRVAISPTQDTLTDFWKHVQKCVRSVADDFRIKHFVLFGIRELAASRPLRLSVVAHGGTVPRPLRGAALHSASYDLRHLPTRLLAHANLSDDTPELFDALEHFPIMCSGISASGE